MPESGVSELHWVKFKSQIKDKAEIKQNGMSHCAAGTVGKKRKIMTYPTTT